MFRSNHLFQQVDGIYLHLQIETPKLTRENIACGFVLQLSVQCASGDHTDSRSTADKQLLPPLLIFTFFGYTICDTQTPNWKQIGHIPEPNTEGRIFCTKTTS